MRGTAGISRLAGAWRRSDWLLAGGAAVALAATADAAWSVHDRFAVDLAGLSALERAGAALWNFRPLAPAVFALGALLVLAGLREPAGRLRELREVARRGLVVLAAAHAAFGLIVLAFAIWIAMAGEVGGEDELGFVYSTGERAVTLATQALAYVPVVMLLAVMAVRAATLEEVEEPEEIAEAPPQPSVAAPTAQRLSDEMEELWRERLAFGPRRERARTLLARIRALEAAGDDESARELAEEMRRL